VRRRFAAATATALVVATGALTTLIIGALAGMEMEEVRHLAVLLLPAAAVSVGATLVSARLLTGASLSQRFVAIAGIAVLVSLANLVVLGSLMSIGAHDVAVVGVLLTYSIGAGVAAAIVTARSVGTAVERLTGMAGRLADQRLEARVGALGAGPELDLLGLTLDEMAERLEESIQRERIAESRRRDLVTAVSHDLRTPLASLQMMVEAIDDGIVDDPPTVKRYAAEMRRSVQSLGRLVDDLFELVQLDAGAIEAESGRACLEEIVSSAMAACEAQALEKGLVLEAQLNGAGEFRCSPRLVRVLQNLLQNAVRHTPPDGFVRAEAHRGPTGVEVVVEDTGEGIPAESLDRIFEPFWRGDEARSGGNSGLGLALAKRIVEALGGEINVQSQPARGTRFAIVLPEGR
jgi:signal transduction histidine kinase